MAKKRYSADEVAKALRDTNGMATKAAEKLGCEYHTVMRYIRDFPSVADAQREAHERLGDNVELTLASEALGKLKEDSREYERFPNTAALIFLAKTKFKERGYTERLEIDVRYVQILKQMETAANKAGIDLADALNDFYAELSEASIAANTREEESL